MLLLLCCFGVDCAVLLPLLYCSDCWFITDLGLDIRDEEYKGGPIEAFCDGGSNRDPCRCAFTMVAPDWRSEALDISFVLVVLRLLSS